MRPETRKYLYDMLQACRAIRRFCDGVTLEQFRANELLQSAVERKLQVLGESIFQMTRKWPHDAERLPGQRDLVNLRHVLVHGYDEMEKAVVYGVVIGYVGALEAALAKALEATAGRD